MIKYRVVVLCIAAYGVWLSDYNTMALIKCWRFKMNGEKKHIITLDTRKLSETVKDGGCGECQTSCQSACKTSCTVGNQSCENSAR